MHIGSGPDPTIDSVVERRVSADPNRKERSMFKSRFTLQTLALVLFILACTSLAQAQATRTFISGVGNDADPCSRTAPCRTWSGAFTKTFINGESTRSIRAVTAR